MEYAEQHLQYEVDMLTGSANVLAFLSRRKNADYVSWLVSNALLNTFSIHARNLVLFLYSRELGKDKRTDIVVQDYVSADDIAAHLLPLSQLLEKTLEKANKQVAHLAMERIAFEVAGKKWHFIDVALHLLKSIASVAPYISLQKISPRLRDKLARPQLTFRRIEIAHALDADVVVGLCLSVGQS
jgi:hypothetical protein